MLRVERVDKKYIDSIKDYKKEMEETNSSMDGCSCLENFNDPNDWVDFCYSLEQVETMPHEYNHFMPAIEYLLLEDDEVVGMFNLRLKLNDFLKKFGGHIGYSVKPSKRRKGYAKKGLNLMLQVCREHHIDNALITCDKTNDASRKTILGNGGVFESELDFNRHHVMKFWVPTRIQVNDHYYNIIAFLGKGKGGYSYEAERDGKIVTLKKIHHEPCDYYTFGNKIESEKNDYYRIKDAGIRIPNLVEIDEKNEIIIKDFIEGDLISDLIKEGKNISEYIHQVREMAKLCYLKNINIDYYPTNFVVQDGLLYYVDFECNEYSEEWNLENWGLETWKK